MPTPTEIKNCNTFVADPGNPIRADAFTATNAHLTNLAAVIESFYDFTATHGRAPNESDVARISQRLLAEWYRSAKREVYNKSYSEPTDFGNGA